MKFVELTIAEIRRRYSHVYSLTVFADLPSYGRDRPGVINGYIPDVFAIDAPESCRVIGEAKTALDCETEHSRQQIHAFLSHLSRFPNSSFFLCVPPLYRVCAETLLVDMAREVKVSSVGMYVIGGV